MRLDAVSVITAMSATINGDAFGTTSGHGTNSASVTGTLTPSTIGTYTLAASATSAGGTGTAGRCDIVVNYNFNWLPPISLGKISKGGSTMPIKFTISDADGNFVTDTSSPFRASRLTDGVLARRVLFGVMMFGRGGSPEPPGRLRSIALPVLL